MSSNSLKPLGYYQSDRRDEIMTTIALEFGDRLERLSPDQKREALIVLNAAHFAETFKEAQSTFNYSISPSIVPRNFYLLAEELTDDGRLALSIALVHAIRTHS